MKKLGVLAFGLSVLFFSSEAQALSFAPGTVFFDANTESECKALGGDFMEWENETFCTQAVRETIPAPFSDIPSEHQNAQAIDYMKTQNIIGGYPDGTFQASRQINRAELTKIVVAFNYEPSEIEACDLTTIELSDVEADAWYAPYICLAKEKSIIKGYDDGTFKPAQNVNLAEASKIMGKAVRSSLSDGNDIWFRPYMEYFSSRNALPTTLKAFDQSVNRGQVSEMLFRVKAKVSNKESLTYGEGMLAAPEIPEEEPKAETLPIYQEKYPAEQCNLMGVLQCGEAYTFFSNETECGCILKTHAQSATTPPPLTCAKCPEGTVSEGMTETSCGQCVPKDGPPPLDCAAFVCPTGTVLTGVTDQSCGTCEPIKASNAEYLDLNVETLQATTGQKKMALFFHANWCPSCVAADKEIRENIGQFPENSVVLKANYDTETKLREKFGVTQQHTVVVIDTANKVVAKLVGFTLDQLKEALK